MNSKSFHFLARLLLPVVLAAGLFGCSGDSDEPAVEINCRDGVLNGAETDVDCGGGDCAGCGLGQACLQNRDCSSGFCDAASTCSCPAGLAADGAGGCADVDECAEGSANCHSQASCYNTWGSFLCICNEGFSGDGVNCVEQSGIEDARQQMKPLVDAACEWMFACCSAGELVYQLGEFTSDAADCSERLLDAITAGIPLDIVQSGLSNDRAEGLLVLALSINRGRVEVDGDGVDACAQATVQRACNQPPETDVDGRCTPPDAGSGADPCDPAGMFTGRQEVGEPCDGPWECRAGLRCIDFGVAGVCALRAGQGENCFSDSECAEDLVCEWDSGTCQPGVPSGEACAFADPDNPLPGTEIIRCLPGLVCNPDTLVCTGGFCTEGAPCGDIFDDSDCPEGTWCVGNSFTQATCQEPGAEGAPCYKTADCQTGFCDPAAETCGALLLNGDLCFSNEECQSGFCSVGMCSPAYGPGQPCPSFDNAECADGYCDTQDPVNPVCQAYSGENDPCPQGFECDPYDGLQCVDAVCLRSPFENGVSCFDGSQCQSRICYLDECAAGQAAGSPCRIDGSMEPCAVDLYCQTPTEVAVDGVCTGRLHSGESCLESEECWGDCVVRFGLSMCDATPALALDEVWCDGP